ncbi:MAG: AAA family ATPase [Myxococcales bacterium]|nr:AAA family ATPase [Myxococcales bacterium]
MRFRRLDLSKFGSFTSERLDFGEPSPDFQVVFGPNEAGKSTTLRAIQGFLYGIPHVSRDVYLHSGSELRISAELQGEAGSERFTRRKGRKATLLDASGEPLPEERLKALLHGVDAEIYAALFGLDHVSLREGGAALARGEGQLGESLYAAGIGAGGVREVLARLRAEAESLYLPRGKRAINQLVARYRETQNQLRLATTEPESWQRQREEVNRQRAEEERLRGRQGELRLEESRLKQLQHLGHVAARLAAAQRDLEVLGEPLRLPDGFREERERWTLQYTSSQREARRRLEDVESVRQELRQLGEPSALADELEPAELEYLEDALGSHRKAIVDLPRRRGELQAVEAEIRQALIRLELPVDSEEPALPGPVVRGELTQLIEERTRLEVTLRQQREDLSELEARRAAVADRLAAQGPTLDLSALEEALERAAEEQPGEARSRELRELERVASLEHVERCSALGVQRFSNLALPSRERLERFLEEIRVEERKLSSLVDELARVESDLERNAQRLASLEGAGELLRPEHLSDARARRDRAWAQVDDDLRSGRLPAPARLRGFESAARQVDALTDGLLGDAERVSQGAELRRGRELLEQARAGAEGRRQVQLERLEELRGAFSLEFPLLDPTDAGLASRFEALLEGRAAEARLVTLRAEIDRLHQRALESRDGLRRCLASYGEEPGERSLSELLKRGKATSLRLSRDLADARADERRARELEEDHAVRLQKLEQTEREHADWSARWERALRALHLPPDTASRVVNERLDDLSRLERQLDKRGSLRGRIAGMERDARRLAEWLEERLQRHAPDLAEPDVARAGAALKRRYQEERSRAEKLRELSERLDRLQRELALARRDEAEAEREVTRLCRMAGVAEASQLIDAERRASEQRRLREVIHERRRELLEGAAGTWDTLEAILAAVRETSAPAIALRLSQLESELGELEEEYRDAIADLERKRAGLQRLSSGSAATRREEQAEVLASLRREVERYRRVKLAELILAREVERYRKENQGPILARANQLFPALTLGRYRELTVGFDAEDRAILEAIPSAARGDEDRVRVDDLSDGARDQLYLALRIASIERYVEAGAALPVVLDDVLVHFDEERARAALVALAALAERTQVLFFTHHRRHVELCAAALGDRFKLHELRRRAA